MKARRSATSSTLSFSAQSEPISQSARAVIPNALTNFDALPDSANVRLPVVAALFACSRTTVWRRAKAKSIPAPKRLSEGVTAWNVGELRKALRGEPWQ